MGARNRVGIGLSYRPQGYISWRNRFRGIDPPLSTLVFLTHVQICKKKWSKLILKSLNLILLATVFLDSERKEHYKRILIKINKNLPTKTIFETFFH